MAKAAQQQAATNARNRLAEKGLVRFEVTGRDADRDLVRRVARRLAENGPEADQLRKLVHETVGSETPRKGGILKTLLASPLVGAELDLSRSHDGGRVIDL